MHNTTATDEPREVFLHIKATNMVLEAITLTGGRTGECTDGNDPGPNVNAAISPPRRDG